MAKEFKLTAKQQAEVRRLNKSISNKKSRIKKEFGVELQIKTKPIKEFGSRKEYNEFVKQSKKFIDRRNFRYVKNPHGVVLRREEYEQIKKDVEKINRRNKRKLNKIDKKTFTSRGKKTDTRVIDRRLMLDPRYDYLRDMDFKKRWQTLQTAQDVENYAEKAANRARDEYELETQNLFKNNYIKSLQNVFGSNANAIIDKVNEMSPEEFEQLYLTEDIVDFDFNYDDQIEVDSKLGYLNMIFGA
jgi:hypothetical protein